MRKLALAAIALACLGGAARPALADHIAKQKVVYHVNLDGGAEDRYYRAAMNNIQNHINAVGVDKIEVKVVMHGDGINLVKNAKASDRLQAAIASLKGQKVDFLVCQNTLTGRKIDRKDLHDVDEEDIVPSGVAELSNLQHHGFTYIKP